MSPLDTLPCPHCGDPLIETPPDADFAEWAYDCADGMWHVEHPTRLTLATAPWTRVLWPEVERLTLLLTDAEKRIARLERILAVERGDQSAAPAGWGYADPVWRRGDYIVARMAGVIGEDGLALYRAVHLSPHNHETHFASTALEAMEAADRAAKESP